MNMDKRKSLCQKLFLSIKEDICLCRETIELLGQSKHAMISFNAAELTKSEEQLRITLGKLEQHHAFRMKLADFCYQDKSASHTHTDFKNLSQNRKSFKLQELALFLFGSQFKKLQPLLVRFEKQLQIIKDMNETNGYLLSQQHTMLKDIVQQQHIQVRG
ncbi:hypothetical protein N9R79_01505 [Vibrio sp.]|nr:hypothetical protein [Vibrio sp.]